MRDGVLFVHNNFPGQFRDLAQTLVAQGVPVAGIGGENAGRVDGARFVGYRLPRGSTPGMFPLAVRAEADMIRGDMARQAAEALKNLGFDPAVVIGHNGWGETTFMDMVFPEARHVAFAEFYYGWRNSDIDFDPEMGDTPLEMVLSNRTKNATMALTLAQADAIVSPTRFQAGTLPPPFATRARIIHEGVDVEAIAAGSAKPVTLPDGVRLAPGDKIVTHVNNSLEPLRGLHILLRALPGLLAAEPQARVVIVGSEKRGYGLPPPEGRSWKDIILEQVGEGLDLSRVHFTGRLEHAEMLDILRLSTAHIYYSYPFVLSWSLCEAMAAGCYVLGSDTGPVRDAIEDGENGRLLPFFDVDALTAAMVDACRRPEATQAMRRAARATALDMFSRAKGRAAWLDLLGELGLPSRS